MAGLFGKTPKTKPSPNMPDPEGFEARAAAARVALQARQRSGRASTNLSESTMLSGAPYAGNRLGVN